MTLEGVCFVDSNIWLYAVTRSEENPPDPRHAIARSLIDSTSPRISIQVINEVTFNLLRKFNFSESQIKALIDSFFEEYAVCPLRQGLLLQASKLRQSYSLSFWDSLIVSAALEQRCNILYTEDMKSGLVIDNTLTIVNPFATEKDA